MSVSTVAHGASSESSELYSIDKILSVAASLAAVLLMVVVLGFFAKRFSGQFGGNQLIKVLSNLPLGTRERVVLIEVGEKRILVGASPGSVSVLHVFDQDDPNALRSVQEMPAVMEKQT
ncbi:MAG: flagellar protein FliO/FliZ [Candidatus Azotimanducaceae bacterium]|jgi:flagellar protein FliO/FliZ